MAALAVSAVKAPRTAPAPRIRAYLTLVAALIDSSSLNAETTLPTVVDNISKGPRAAPRMDFILPIAVHATAVFSDFLYSKAESADNHQ